MYIAIILCGGKFVRDGLGSFFYCFLAETQWHNLISDMKYIYGLFSKILELLVRVGRDTY